jgi:hypothetical protein
MMPFFPERMIPEAELKLYSTRRIVRRFFIRSRAWTSSSLSRTAMSRCTVRVASCGPGTIYSLRMRLASSTALQYRVLIRGVHGTHLTERGLNYGGPAIGSYRQLSVSCTVTAWQRCKHQSGGQQNVPGRWCPCPADANEARKSVLRPCCVELFVVTCNALKLLSATCKAAQHGSSCRNETRFVPRR